MASTPNPFDFESDLTNQKMGLSCLGNGILIGVGGTILLQVCSCSSCFIVVVVVLLFCCFVVLLFCCFVVLLCSGL